MSSEIVLSQADREALLSPRELREYQIYMRLGQPPMAASTQAKFFQLFLNGQSCEEIVRLNPGGFSLGAIVRARIENNWDALLQEHRQELMYKIKERVQQTTLETLDRLCLELAASNKLNGDKVKRFLQTGDATELEGTQVGTTKHMKELVQALANLLESSGPPKKPSVPGSQVNVNINNGPPQKTIEGTALPIVTAGKPLPASTAASALEAIHKARQK